MTPLAVEVSQLLDRLGISHALIGAGALVTIGTSRATVDLDFLVVDQRLLDEAFWPTGCRREPPYGPERRTEAPLAGPIRLSAPATGRSISWSAAMLGKARSCCALRSCHFSAAGFRSRWQRTSSC